MRVPRFQRYLRLQSRKWLQRTVFWGGALTVGLVAIGFAWLADLATHIFQNVEAVSPFLMLLATPLTLAVGVLLTQRVFPGAEGSGIPQTIAALEMIDPEARSKVLSLRIAIGKIFLTVLGLCGGASVGREGPTVQIGAAILHTLGQKMHMTRIEMQRGLILGGGAAGVAAAFNTPLAGVVFAIEELSRSFEARTNGLVLTAVILAGVTSMAVLGNYRYFGVTSVGLVLGHAWVAVLACGIVGGLAGGIFSQGLILASRRGLPGRLGAFRRESPVRFAALCGLLIAIIGIISGGATYGTGYEQAKGFLTGSGLSPTFAVEKMAATVLSYLSGIPGGIFAPSLSIGAGLGASVAPWLPSAPVEAVVLLGMVGYFSGVVQAPITAVVIVLEMTDNSEMTIPLMATAVIAYAVSKIVCPEPFYKAMAHGFLNRVQVPKKTEGASV
ncbi:chloride channel protein [Novispirillum itersonii]|uniref:H+/Cl- antiporter ClcA n=1 Tax=Novispirillum itersonii TaxID=189 RepID=A0A7X0DL15_NOVIT|nr:chloride channel protein [Novispirillum itersonii]MBB6209505.1 H+/Cl- antiporter ClcA [Novispirillum itersonii]